MQLVIWRFRCPKVIVALFLFSAVAVCQQATNTGGVPDKTRFQLRTDTVISIENAFVGQTVILSTDKAVKLKNGTVIPKGARVAGRITEVRGYDTKFLESRLSFVVTEVKWDGGELTLNAYIVGDLSIPGARAGDVLIARNVIVSAGGTVVGGCVRNKYSPPNSEAIKSPSLRLIPDPNPDINSVLVCDRADVLLPAGSKFTVSQVNE